MTSLLRAGLVCLLLTTAAVSGQGNAPVPQAPTPPAAAAISGVVVDGATNAPVAGAIVALAATERAAPGPQPRQMTDSRGRFVFANLPGDAAYTLSASKFGYLDGGYGRDSGPFDSLRPLNLRPDEWVANTKVTIWRPGTVSGAVRDEAGEMVVGVYVRALLRVRLQGRDELVAGPMTVTDDRGAYRLSGLTPGRYVIQVPSVQASVPVATSIPAARGTAPDGVLETDSTTRLVVGRYPLPPPRLDGRPMAYPVVFHPAGTTLAEAAIVELGFGEDRSNVDIVLAPVPTARVSGTVEGPPDALVNLTLRLLPAGLEDLGVGSEVATALVGSDGRFTFLNVPAGNYAIDAPLKINEFSSSPTGRNFSAGFPAPPGRGGWSRMIEDIDLAPGITFSTTDYRGGAAAFSGRGSVVVGGADVAGVTIKLKPTGTVSGVMKVETDPNQPKVQTPSRFGVRLDPTRGSARLGSARSQPPSEDMFPEEFIVTGIEPGEYWLRVVQPNWLVKSVIWKGQDYTNAPLDVGEISEYRGVIVTVTNAAPVLSGVVRGSDGAPPDAALVIVFPSNRAWWQDAGLWPARLKSTAIASNGSYRMTTLPAGDYLVAAINPTPPARWRDPEFLAQLERSAARVTLSWGAPANQDLTLTVIR